MVIRIRLQNEICPYCKKQYFSHIVGKRHTYAICCGVTSETGLVFDVFE